MEENKKTSKIKLIKEFLSDKRNKALVKLGFWLIFFIFVIIYIRIMNSINNKNYVNSDPIIENLPQTITESIKSLKDVNSYEFRYIYNLNGNNYEINGQAYDDKILINFNKNKYYYDGINLYLLSETSKEQIESNNIKYIQMISPSKIYSYLLKSEYNFKQENADKSIKINSKIKITDFGNQIGEELISEQFITFETTELNNSLNDIVVDLTSYCNLQDPNCLDLNVIVKYDNINLIEDFNY